jgi:hypothetical protein
LDGLRVGGGQQKVEYRLRTVYDVPPLNKKGFGRVCAGWMARQLQEWV